MTAFVESCVETTADSAAAAERRSRGRPKVRKLLRLLEGKQRILITAHQHPDPDALASAMGMRELLSQHLPQSEVVISAKGRVGGGLNEAFVKYSKLSLVPWDEKALAGYDAIILLDTQPTFAFTPLPPDIKPTAVIDHHACRGHRPHFDFCDIRADAGATASIVFSYFMEMETPINRQLAATLLYGIETDLAGAAGTPGELDNIALSSLTLLADTHRLYQMRYVDLSRDYYVAFAQGLNTAELHEHSMVSHLQEIDSLERCAVLADFLLRFQEVDWVLVTGIYDGRLILSLRTSNGKRTASEVMKKLIRGIGEGGGHTTKAGGFVRLESATAAELAKTRELLLRRLLRILGIKKARGKMLVG